MPRLKENSAMFKQYNAIKERLIKHFNHLQEQQGLTISAVQLQLASADDGFDVSYTALRDVLTPNNNKVPNLCIIIGLCRIWHLDYAEILASPESGTEISPSLDALTAKSKVLDDPKYLGTYYGYMYSRNKKRTEIASFELSLKKIGTSVNAQMHLHTTPSTVSGERKPFRQTFTGTPLLLNKVNIIFLLLTSESGDFYSLYFDYQTYNFDRLYFRKGIAITTESNSNKPMFNNFLLFQKPINKTKREKIFPGMLKIIDTTFVVPKKHIDAFIKNNHLHKLLHKYCDPIERKYREVYLIKPKQLLDNVENELDNDEIIEAMQFLFTLQGLSLSPERIEYSNLDGLPGFAKKYLQT